MSAPRRMHLNAFVLSSGHHEAAWRHPASTPERMFDAGFYAGLARTAEAAAFDAVFLADIPKLDDNVAHNAVGRLDPLLVLANVAAVTERIGLVATASTTYSHPWALARAFASLDHLSAGRAAWNIVTTDSTAAARNFGLEANPDPGERYERAHEHVEAVRALWDSWEDDAVRLDRAGGRYADPDAIHPPRIRSGSVRVDGALTTPRPPQGHPVLVQAGASDHGRDFAARHAEAIFTAQQRLPDAQAFVLDIRRRRAAAGLDPAGVRILPGLCPFVADTEAAALALQREFDDLIEPEYGLIQLRDLVGIDASGLPLDEPVPIDLVADAGELASTVRSRRTLVATIIRRERPTLRRLLQRLAGGRGHRVVAGTPDQVADTMAEWFREGAADGFNVMPPWLPGGLEVFATTVVPLLRERGLFREGYSGTTLREHLGLARPVNRHAVAR